MLVIFGRVWAVRGLKPSGMREEASDVGDVLAVDGHCIETVANYPLGEGNSTDPGGDFGIGEDKGRAWCRCRRR